ncbi:methionine/alanine import NSS transporter subunit MetS [Corynebacterium callunae]|uniref:Methionine and alanine importer, small subunit n=1 Tax=Corynebacterium callunae DSM 20147 TaxID=1121353 RepID=M1UTD4_9CORY|nr:methionine/alanine import NSS transporter subunit MetS [Corynebacterium callunae]AGG66417.1 hypothetical protein H924_04855 [Corynebacterium callunae DSM 20147]
MSTLAITMMVLFILIIWGGLVISTIALRRFPDESVGDFGTSPYATDEVLIDQEFHRH